MSFLDPLLGVINHDVTYEVTRLDSIARGVELRAMLVLAR
jgi:hypothetical protein